MAHTFKGIVRDLQGRGGRAVKGSNVRMDKGSDEGSPVEGGGERGVVGKGGE